MLGGLEGHDVFCAKDDNSHMGQREVPHNDKPIIRLELVTGPERIRDRCSSHVFIGQYDTFRVACRCQLQAPCHALPYNWHLEEDLPVVPLV